jgi:hypothetical protein
MIYPDPLTGKEFEYLKSSDAPWAKELVEIYAEASKPLVQHILEGLLEIFRKNQKELWSKNNESRNG